MCIILAIPPGTPIPLPEHLERSNVNNPHGWGVSINLPVACATHACQASPPVPGCARCVLQSSLVIARGFDTESLIAAVDDLQAMRKQNPLSAMVVHCRIATSGAVNLDNTHPFEVNWRLLLFHNGIFPEALVPITNPSRPDTWHLAREMFYDFFENGAPDYWLEQLCKKSHSKVALLDSMNGISLYNDATWVPGGDGRWYSNKSAFTAPWTHMSVSAEDSYDEDDEPWVLSEDVMNDSFFKGYKL
jgi:hypothetical protein